MRSPYEPDISVRFAGTVSCTYGLHVLAGPGGAARLRCARSCDAEAPKEYVRRMAEHDDAGITPEVWRKIVDLGWTGVLVPEAQGGLGLGIVDAVVVQEEMGRAVFPGPFFSSAILATLAARALGLDERLAALAAGTERGTVALDEAGHGDPLERVRVRADGRGTRYTPRRREADGDGRPQRRLDARARADRVKGCSTFLVERPPTRALAPSARHHAQVRAPRVRRARAALLVGPPGDHAAIWRRVARRRRRAPRRRAHRCDAKRPTRSRSTTRRRARCSASRCRSSR